MIKIIVPAIKKEEIELIFTKFDEDLGGTISFMEF